MEIVVDRFISDEDSTVSHVRVDGRFICFGLEDEYREDKVPEETRIPAGTYEIGLRTEGGHHLKYLRRYPDFHRGMLHILDVPDFQWILIHCGNTDHDTAGCLLVGRQADTTPGDMRLVSSRAAYEHLYPLVVNEAAAGNLTIRFEDNEGH